MSDLALDIGGANIKAAHRGGATASVAFALWREPEQLAERLHQLARMFPPFDRLLVTMTAELCDCFATKREGVNHVLDAAEALAAGRPVRAWVTSGRFVAPAQARGEPLKAAASNWHALASFVAGLYPRGRSLLIDTGSTTTDIIPLRDGRPDARGLTDFERLASGELVYTGVTRTPLMAVAPAAECRGRAVPVMAERFAITADVYLLTGDLPEDPENTDTADGRPMTRAAAAARIVRMVGADLEMFTMDDAVALARGYARCQEKQIVDAIVSRMGEEQAHMERAIVSGGGDFLAARVAAVALREVPVIHLGQTIGQSASTAACAYALLQLCPP